MPIFARAGAVAALMLALAGCATTHAPATPGDPLERWNRGVQKLNDAIDRAVVRPAARGYQRVVPRPLRTGIGNVLGHLAFPTTIVNDLLQGKFADFGADLGRFALNSTLGLGGLLDPASSIGIRRNDEDFGQTLGRWGVPPGPYLVLPLLGPSTLRDAPAMAADAQTDLRVQLDITEQERVALALLYVLDTRANLLSTDATVDAAFDRYAFIRNAWLQRREFQVRDGDVPEEPLEELEELEDPEAPGDPEDAAEPEAPQEPRDQPVPAAVSSASTSPMRASVRMASGALR
ncbi:MAG TPA: VacJ family lipoprotein [Steroidobacteraceae bacterium]|nr:VacJ family lipoprotein [Steroidobacteraceae bacterium]